MAQYWQRGESLDYENTGNEKILNEDIVVIGAKIGVAGCDIAPGTTGSLHVEGVFAFEATGFTAGQYVKYDGTTLVAATDITDAHGWVVYDSDATKGLTYVKLIG